MNLFYSPVSEKLCQNCSLPSPSWCGNQARETPVSGEGRREGAPIHVLSTPAYPHPIPTPELQSELPVSKYLRSVLEAANSLVMAERWNNLSIGRGLAFRSALSSPPRRVHLRRCAHRSGPALGASSASGFSRPMYRGSLVLLAPLPYLVKEI